MKRFTTIISATLLLLAWSNVASARGVVIGGGINFPSFDVKEIKEFNYKSFTGWHAVIGYQSGSWAGFTLQPEVAYQVRGVNFDDAKTLKMNDLQLNLNVQWGIDLFAFKPFIFASPFAGYNFSNEIVGDATGTEALLESLTDKLNFGFGAGIGIDVWKIQITAKYNWDFGRVNFGAYKEELGKIKTNAAAFEVTAALKF